LKDLGRIEEQEEANQESILTSILNFCKMAAQAKYFKLPGEANSHLLAQNDGIYHEEMPNIYCKILHILAFKVESLICVALARPSSRITAANIAMFVVSMFSLACSAILYIKSLQNHLNPLAQVTFDRVQPTPIGHESPANNIMLIATVPSTLEAKWDRNQYITYPLSSKESVYRQKPSMEVDKAWDRITDIGVLIVSSEEVVRMGKDPSLTVKAPESWGYGSDAHLAHLDGIHLIHCLDAMRRGLHFNFGYYNPSGNVSKVYLSHMSHCIDSLRHHLMCQPSVELITYNWVERQEHPFPDFDISRKCWNFDSLMEWQEKNRVKDIANKWDELKMPSNYQMLPVPTLMLEAYNVTREEAGKLP
jgi:hypothetical protein